jgi:hypothetical protein
MRDRGELGPAQPDNAGARSNESAPERGQAVWLGNRRRRVLEQRKLEVGANEMEARESGSKRARRRERRYGDRGRRRVLVFTGGQEGNRALVIGRRTCRMDLLMKVRDRGKDEREEDRADATCRDQRVERRSFAVDQPQAHWKGSVRPQGSRCKPVLVFNLGPS